MCLEAAGELIQAWQNRNMDRALELIAEVVQREGAHPELDLGLPPRVRARRPARRKRNENQAMMSAVGEFHVAFQLPISLRPQDQVPADVAALRIELLREEFEEFKQAVQQGDAVAIADALGDIVYVAYGTAVTYGIDLDAVLREIHRANMSKLGPDGRPEMRADGKVLKPETYRPPNIAGVLLDQPPLFLDWDV